MLTRTAGAEDLLVDAALAQDDDSSLLARLDRDPERGKALNAAARAHVDGLLNTLGAPEGALLRRHFGLEDGSEPALEDLGRRIGSGEARHLREEALRKLREPHRY